MPDEFADAIILEWVLFVLRHVEGSPKVTPRGRLKAITLAAQRGIVV